MTKKWSWLLIPLGGLLVWHLTKEKPPEGAAVTIVVRDSEGNIVEEHSPLDLYEGKSYTATASVTNKTTADGFAYEADFNINIFGYVVAGGTSYLLFGNEKSLGALQHFAANETLSFTQAFTVPLGWYGLSGEICCAVLAPGNILVATARVGITLKALAKTYAASVTLTV